ncbi:MAG TPA: ribonuclease H-like domain-containing protein [Thermoplasmata archaeon]|nr:ribonuclease H-like domain-containing protein [Thermoplasmata archaeon]
MLRSTFLHLSGIGPATEAWLWGNGVQEWSELGEWIDTRGVAVESGRRWRREIAASEGALAERRAGYFAERLPPGELWRLYSEFRRTTAFLDIETTGLSPYEGIVTVVTVHGNGATRTFIADDNLEELPAYLRRFDLLATFNGKLFDVPFLEARFPGLRVPAAHLDLRYILRRLGYSGGLKRIEQVLGLGDRSGVEGIHGIDAVRLWEQFRRGSTSALDQLVKYNHADTVNLEPLLEFATGELRKRLLRIG